ncbi:MAG: long-chain fatty aldehyde decarbonylase [Myxococcota bacterium]
MKLHDVVETEEEAQQRRLHSGNLYRVDHWRRSTQRYLGETSYGYSPGNAPKDQAAFRELPSALYHSVVASTAQSLAGEQIALECSAALCSMAPDERARMYLATQVIDEARHVEVFTHRLALLGKTDPNAAIQKYANPKLLEFGAKLRKLVLETRDFAGGVAGQNLALEGLALGVFEFTSEFYKQVDPGYSEVLDGVVADERRHVGFGVTRVREILENQRERMDELVNRLGEMTEDMMAMFHDVASAMASYGMDVDDVMGRVKTAHATHRRRLGIDA